MLLEIGITTRWNMEFSTFRWLHWGPVRFGSTRCTVLHPKVFSQLLPSIRYAIIVNKISPCVSVASFGRKLMKTDAERERERERQTKREVMNLILNCLRLHKLREHSTGASGRLKRTELLPSGDFLLNPLDDRPQRSAIIVSLRSESFYFHKRKERFD